MMLVVRSALFHQRLLALAGLLTLVAGCASDPGPRGRHAAAPIDAPSAPPAPEMAAQAHFFSGQVEVEVLLGRAGFAARDAARASAAGGGESRGRGGFSGGFGGGGGRAGGGGGRGGGDGGSDMAHARPGGDGPAAANIRPSNAPPVQFRLRLTHHGSEAIEVEVPDFNSALGNFVVQPRKVTLAPGGSVELDPMTSRLGVTSDEIPLTVSLRVAGKTEKQILVLRPKVAPPAPPAPAASVPTA